MKVVVADTSALMRLYVPDGPIPDNFEQCIESAWRGETVIMVPEIALAEIVQVLWKKQKSGYLKGSEVEEIVTAILELPLEIVGHRDLILEALSFARQHDLTIYDSLFLALTKKMNGILITADNRLQRAYEM